MTEDGRRRIEMKDDTLVACSTSLRQKLSMREHWGKKE